MLAYLVAWPSSQTVWGELIDMKDMNSTFNTEMVKLAGDL